MTEILGEEKFEELLEMIKEARGNGYNVEAYLRDVLDGKVKDLEHRTS